MRASAWLPMVCVAVACGRTFSAEILVFDEHGVAGSAKELAIHLERRALTPRNVPITDDGFPVSVLLAAEDEGPQRVIIEARDQGTLAEARVHLAFSEVSVTASVSLRRSCASEIDCSDGNDKKVWVEPFKVSIAVPR